MTPSADKGEILVVGAGLSGATVARILAENGFAVLVVEKGRGPGGHCHTYRDQKTGVMVHTHGPHIFHSDDADVWSFVERFATFETYDHHVVALTGGRTFPLPITLNTIRAFFNQALDSTSANKLVSSLAKRYPHAPRNFEEQGRHLLGDALYEAFFDSYTRKQWGAEPSKLPASIFRRTPIRFSEDQNYFHHSRVGIPRGGYTEMISRMLEHPSIRAIYGHEINPAQVSDFLHTVYTGPLDAWFDFRFGRLRYRTLDFEKRYATGQFQEVAQVNYCDMSVPWTRITEHKHFAPWERHAGTVYFTETSRDCGPSDTPYYPVHFADAQPILERYLAAARAERGVSFVGRLATFQYIDMDVAVARASKVARLLHSHLRNGSLPPTFLP